MSNMISKDVLEELYHNRKLSVEKVAIELNVSKDFVRQQMKHFEIVLRSKQESSYLQHNKSFTIKNNLSPEEKILYGMGLGLYWGEGNKVSEYSVRLGNTDPKLIQTFLNFLLKICGIQEKDIKFGLQIFNDSSIEDSIEYWISILKFPRESFHKSIVVIPPQGKGTYKKKSKYGVLQIYVNNKRLKQWIMSEINQYADVAQG